MTIAADVLGLVGHTPLVRLSRVGKGLRPTIVAKLEHLNPGGYVKERIGLLLIADAERPGLLKPGGTLDSAAKRNPIASLPQGPAIKGEPPICPMDHTSGHA